MQNAFLVWQDLLSVVVLQAVGGSASQDLQGKVWGVQQDNGAPVVNWCFRFIQGSSAEVLVLRTMTRTTMWKSIYSRAEMSPDL